MNYTDRIKVKSSNVRICTHYPNITGARANARSQIVRAPVGIVGKIFITRYSDHRPFVLFDTGPSDPVATDLNIDSIELNQSIGFVDIELWTITIFDEPRFAFQNPEAICIEIDKLSRRMFEVGHDGTDRGRGENLEGCCI